MVAVFFGVAMVLWWVPVLVSAPVLARHHLAEPHRVAHPPWEWLGLPGFALPWTVGAAAALGAVALATIPSRAHRPADVSLDITEPTR